VHLSATPHLMTGVASLPKRSFSLLSFICATSLLTSSLGVRSLESQDIHTDPTITPLSIPLANLIFSYMTTRSPSLNYDSPFGDNASSNFISGISLIDLSTATQPSDSTFHYSRLLYYCYTLKHLSHAPG